MFVSEGMNRVREVNEKNRKHKLTKHKKLSNNILIEIDHCSPLEMLLIQTNLTKIADGEEIASTFMMMEEDHMKNGQLKSAYNVQVAVENHFIIHSYISNDRTDYNTLIPVLERHKNTFEAYLKEVTEDSGYSNEKNLLYLKDQGVKSYIKL